MAHIMCYHCSEKCHNSGAFDSPAPSDGAWSETGFHSFPRESSPCQPISISLGRTAHASLIGKTPRRSQLLRDAAKIERKVIISKFYGRNTASNGACVQAHGREKNGSTTLAGLSTHRILLYMVWFARWGWLIVAVGQRGCRRTKRLDVGGRREVAPCRFFHLP